MEFKRFSLGLRFALTADAALTPETVWALVFSQIPAALVAGLTLLGAWDDTAESGPEPAYVCIFSSMPLKRAKRLYRAVAENQLLCSYLTAYMPFVQNNWVEKCENAERLGQIGQDGALAGGDAAYAGMRFAGAEPPARDEKAPRLLIAAEAIGQDFPPADVARRMARAAVRVNPLVRVNAVRISDGGRGTVDTMVAACCGRYARCPETGTRYGVLPDRTVVLETEQLTDEQVSATLECIMRDGYRAFLLAAGKRRMRLALPPGVTATVLRNPVPVAPYDDPDVTYASGVATVLEHSGFLRACADSDAVVLATVARDESCALLGAAADTVRFHCGQNHVPFSILARYDENTYIICPHGQPAERIATDDFDLAARALLARLTICAT